jgi:glycine betaine/proline transport system ATP-binding protein
MKDGQVVQIGTPEEILRHPADDYVRNFIRGVDTAAVFKAGDIARKTQVVVAESRSKGCRAALKMLQDSDRNYAFVVSPSGKYLGLVSEDSLRSALQDHEGPLGLQHAYLPDVSAVSANHPVAELFNQVAAPPWPVPVVDDLGQYCGAISKTTLLRFLDRNTSA